MPRTFSGSVAVDYLQFSTGAADFKYGTVAAIVRRNAPSTWDCIFSSSTSASAGVFAFEFSNAVSGALTWYDGAVSNNNNAPTVHTGDGWTFVAASKASGSATPVWYKQALTASSMTTTTAGCNSSNAASVGSSGFLQLGRWETTDYMNGDIAVVGVWPNTVLSADQIGELPYSLAAWHSLSPSALWVLDQETVSMSVPDLTGFGANQRARSGTTVASSVELISFTYGAPVVMVLPSAATTATSHSMTAAVAGVASFTAGLAAEFSLAAAPAAVSSFAASGMVATVTLSPAPVAGVSTFSACGMVSTVGMSGAFGGVSSFTATTLSGIASTGLTLDPVTDPGGLSLTPYSDPGGLSLTPYSDPGGLTLTPVT